ncbi:methyltransferase-like protein 23 isoform X3 [Oryzias melastigma]|uniref:methyltransferase-like protein 23 isoform X3 n=1 Tax=Oryzias melastigma TaxID=30732 RepID=UPI000CF80293|nr:methyltransferase-like protein 23 isoform X3 [Oryzias melastigma]
MMLQRHQRKNVYSDQQNDGVTAVCFSIEIYACLQVLDPQYGMYVWPCAVVLAQFVWTHRAELSGKTVLEIGAGVSLPGVVAARCGARLFLSDSSEKPSCLQNCRRSGEANGLSGVSVLGLSWGEVPPDLLLLPELDVVLGSDVFYDPEDFEDVLVTIAFLLRKNPRARFWTTYQRRLVHRGSAAALGSGLHPGPSGPVPC